MTLKNIKLLSFDLDGTLFHTSKKLTDKTVESLRYAKEKGIKLVINSGRPCSSVNESVPLELFDYIISNNGQAIISLQTGEILTKPELNESQLRDIFEISIHYPVMMNAYNNGITYLSYGKKFTFLANLIQLAFIIRYRMRFPKSNTITDLQKYHVKQSPKVCFAGFHFALVKLQSSLRQKGFNCCFVSSIWLEVMNHGISKGQALTELCQSINIDLSDTVAFGDGENDISMLESAGIGVAMQNASQAVKKSADCIADYNFNDGVAKWIKDNL